MASETPARRGERFGRVGKASTCSGGYVKDGRSRLPRFSELRSLPLRAPDVPGLRQLGK
jgi:hypothetical protein